MSDEKLLAEVLLREYASVLVARGFKIVNEVVNEGVVATPFGTVYMNVERYFRAHKRRCCYCIVELKLRQENEVEYDVTLILYGDKEDDDTQRNDYVSRKRMFELGRSDVSPERLCDEVMKQVREVFEERLARAEKTVKELRLVLRRV